MAHPGGKIVSGDKKAALAALLARKQKAGLELTADQRRALADCGDVNALPVCRDAAVRDDVAVNAARERIPIAAATRTIHTSHATEDGRKRERALRKKLREIDVLESRAKEGAILQANQQEKIAGKAAIERELRELM
jgi:uncharacterized protein with WD repeat